MNILIIGDSHVDTTDAYLKNAKTACFGQILADDLRSAGNDVTLAGVGGSRIEDWLGEEVSRKGKTIDPDSLPKGSDLLIVVLGSNDMGKGGDAAEVVSSFPQLVERFSPKQALWLGPPKMRTKSSYNNANMAKLYDEAARQGIAIFDSRASTAPYVDAGDGDGIHSGPQSAQAWAQAVSSQLGGSSGSNTLVILGAALGALWLWKRGNA